MLCVRRFAIYIWDYRGVLRAGSAAGCCRFAVHPANDPSLTLSLIVHDDAEVKRKTIHGPTIADVPVAGMVRKVNVTLRHEDEIVCESLWEESTERFLLKHKGFYNRPPVGPEADPIDSGSTVAEATLPFMVDSQLARMVARDVAELDSAVQGGNAKSAVLLAGSILEAVLLDVLNRNEPEARRILNKKWPDRASAMDLIATASGIRVSLPDGSERALLRPLIAKKGAVVVDHRDLIHPRAEVRGAASIDVNTVQTMRGVLGEILRDLRAAHVDGVLDAYANGNVV